MAQLTTLVFLGDWGSDETLDLGTEGRVPECSWAQRAIGRQIAGNEFDPCVVISVGDTFYTDPPAASNQSATWFAHRLSAAAGCVTPGATAKEWRFVPGNHDQEAPLCPAYLPQRLHGAADWSAFPAPAHEPWWAEVIGGVLVLGIDTNCIIDAAVIDSADDKKALRAATAPRDAPCGPRTAQALGEVADRQTRWLQGVVAEAGRRNTPVILVGHHPLLVDPHSVKDKKRVELDAMHRWWTHAGLHHQIALYVCGHEHNLQVVHGDAGSGFPTCVVSGAGGGNTKLDTPVRATAIGTAQVPVHRVLGKAVHGYVTAEVGGGKIHRLKVHILEEPDAPRQTITFEQ